MQTPTHYPLTTTKELVMMSSSKFGDASIQRLAPWPAVEEFHTKLDAMTKARCTHIVSSNVDGTEAMTIHCGDICGVAADYVVTPALPYFIGCYVLDHACIDQAVHRAAGPGLRRECMRRVREMQTTLSTTTSHVKNRIMQWDGGLATRIMKPALTAAAAARARRRSPC